MRAFVFIAVSMLCWSLMEILGPGTGVSGYQVVWTRYGVHLLGMLILLGPRHGARLVRTPHLGQQVFRSLLMLGMPLCFLWSVERIAFRNTLAVFWICPLVLIAVTQMFGEKSGSLKLLLATVPGFLGAMLIYRPDARVLHPAAVLALVMALCFAMYLVVSRRMKEEFIFSKLFHTALWVFASLTVFLPWFWLTPTIRGFASVVAIAVLGWCGLFMLDRAVELSSPAHLAPMLYLQVVGIVLIEAVTTRHLPGPRNIVGVLFIAIGLVVAVVRNYDLAMASDTIAGYPR